MREISGKLVYDSLEEIVRTDHTALLIVDVQNDFCAPNGYYDRYGKDLSMSRTMIPRLVEFLAESRSRGIPVVFIQNSTLPDGLSDSPAWLYYKTRDGKGPDYTLEGSWGADFVDELQPLSGEAIVKKHRSSAFVHTDLDLILRNRGAESVIVTGVLTQACVESTAMHAAFLDYYPVILSDCVATVSRELHEAALKVMASRFTVCSSEQIRAAWGRDGQEKQ